MHNLTRELHAFRLRHITNSAHPAGSWRSQNLVLCAGIPIEDSDVADLGATLTAMMSEEQLRLAHLYFNLNHAPRLAMTVSLDNVRRVYANHWRSILKMPAGGASAGGSMQTGFEMEMITAAAVRKLFKNWPNYESIRMGHSWEARNMQECAVVCAFQDQPAGWGCWNGKPAPPTAGSKLHAALLLASPPITVTWQLRADTTTLLTVRTALTIFTEEDAMVLPPDDKESKPFYVDPPDRPGYTRDLFRSHALLMAKELLDSGHPLTPRLGRLSSEAPIK
jgi:hypothetical protein